MGGCEDVWGGYRSGENQSKSLCSQPWTRRPAGAIRCSSPLKCLIRGFSAWRMQLGGFAVFQIPLKPNQSLKREQCAHEQKPKLEMNLLGTESGLGIRTRHQF